MPSAPRYFAYGSNLNARDLRRWCDEKQCTYPLARAVARAYLPDWELAFSYRSKVRNGGALDLCRRAGQLVPGVVFEVGPGGWEVLDRKEGAGRNYRRMEVQVLDEEGGVVPAMTYVVRDERKQPHVPPRVEYLDTVREGMRAHEVEGQEQLAAAADDLAAPWLVDALFAYGTLMRGERFFRGLAERAELRCALLATIRGRLHDLGDYPGLRLDREGPLLRGELIRFGNVDAVLAHVDRIEGFEGYAADSLYDRVLLRVDAGDGRSRLAWTYVMASPSLTGREIASGCWRSHKGRFEPFVRALARAHSDGREAEIVAEITSRAPFRPDGSGDGASLLPLASAILSGVLSEGRLAQVSGRWACLTD